MDQIKTGKFISSMRKEQGLTQKDLAEKLFISDKTVSKWETGRGLPEVSLMLPLCEILNINVNELLTGERIADESYKEKAEENMMNLIKSKRGRGKIIALMFMLMGMMLMPMIIVTVIYSWLDKNKIEYNDIAAVLGILTFVSVMLSVIAIMFVDCSVGYYECSECGEKFVPSFTRYATALFHRPTARKMRCPKCGKKNWCTKNLY